jgi:ATP-binding cassette, subfamily B, bacterial PglK
VNQANPIPKLPNLLVRLWRHLSQRRQRQFALLVLLILISALADVISLGAVLPFLGVLSEPEVVFNHPVLMERIQGWGFTSPEQLVFPLTIAFIITVVIAGAIRILFLWASTRVAFATGADLGIKVYHRTLCQPYWVQVNRNSSDVISSIANKVNNVVFEVLLPLLTISSSFVLLVAITIALVIIDPIVALVASAGFGACYGLISLISRQRLHRNSQRIAHEQTQVVKVVQEGLGGIRDVLLDGTQSTYCNIYSQADHPLRRAQASNIFIGSSPRYTMEALGMVLIATLAYNLNNKAGGLPAALPILGALALAAQRMLPAMQLGYSAWTSIAGCEAALVNTISLLDQPLPEEETKPSSGSSVSFKDVICFNNVHFRYTNDGPWVLNGLNLTIPKGTRIGFVGSTGSGKSTTLDLLMGLLIPTKGKLLVDGQQIIGSYARAWQKTIAHVPQNIYLADTTLSENIAFGILPESIDMSRVKEAAQQAHIDDFIESQPGGYSAVLGERGVRLSGGQRQRIGIARALYKKANVLVFDEATSALDNETEKSVMEAIEGLKRDFTILIIAHRLTTVQNCDIIVEMGNGKVVAQGTYEQLFESNSKFCKSNTIAKKESS